MKNILLLGASGGIGSEVANHLLNQGYAVTGTYNSGSISSSLINHSSFTSAKIDLTEESDLSTFTPPDKFWAIVNCTGIVEFTESNHIRQNTQIWDKTILTNLTSPYLVYLHLSKHILPGGSYIMTSSTDSYFGAKSTVAYAVSKSGLNSLTKSLALNYADTKIRVNTIAPGWVETQMMSAGGDELVEYAKSINPFNRNCKPDEIAELIEFLISDKCQYLNGQIITLDGGYTLQDPTLIFEAQQISKS